MNLQAVDIREAARAPALWQEIVDASDDGWILHTWLSHEFNLCAGEQYNAQDLSFFVYEDGKPVGVVPLIVQEKSVGGLKEREAMYYSGFLPWPCFRQDVSNREESEDFAFAELERRIRGADAHIPLVLLMPPQSSTDDEDRVKRIAALHGFTPKQFDRHMVIITEGMLRTVRRTFRRYYKKYAPFFALSIAEGSALSPELEETYFQLHIKDAGGQFRSRESYTKQMDSAREGEGFYVVATHKESGIIAGMLLMSLYKNAAYPNSIAVDPDFANQSISYLLYWKAIEELQERHVPTYEFGQKADPASATQKELTISRFKEGWSQGHTRTIWGMEKLLES